ncbi:T-lymphocyte activation antigen CD80 [Zootoca vivipara]|uniref:T-lymphocyte activation antigen CD80 n=1 Tax=Zootoca vivipara TaxID=8524 RepID=UPI00293BB717|nr:T-lymphocyte activation antigen CD80 [Zootoca vivipara]
MYTQKRELMLSTTVLKWFLWLGLFVLPFGCSDTVPVTAKVGGVATLPCNYKMQQPLASYRIYWQKYVGPGISDLVVIAYSNGEENTVKDIHFQNRTKMDEKNLTLWISGVNVSDQGKYKCIILLKEEHKGEKWVHLSVSADYRKPVIHVSHNPCGPAQLTLMCSSHGGYPEAEMSWLVNNETVRYSYMTSIYDNYTKSFNITGNLQQNVSEDILVQCQIHYSGLQVSTDYHLSIEKCPNPSPPPPPHGFITASIVILVVLALVIVPTTFLRCRRRKHMTSHQPVAASEITSQQLSNGTLETCA